MTQRRKKTLKGVSSDVLKSIQDQREVMGDYGGGSLREYLWAVASGCTTFAALGETLGITRPQISRMTRTLHKLNYTGADGLDLIEVTFDLRNPRVKLVTLSAKGEAVLRAEWETITGDTLNEPAPAITHSEPPSLAMPDESA